MSVETRKVLEMLAAGKITPDDAEKLLDALNASPTDSPEASAEAGAAGTRKQRFLRIVVEKPGEKQTNVRIPLAFAGLKLLGVLPTNVSEGLSEYGIDVRNLSSMKEEDLARICEQMNIDIDKGNGKKVRIFCE